MSYVQKKDNCSFCTESDRLPGLPVDGLLLFFLEFLALGSVLKAPSTNPVKVLYQFLA